MIQSRFELDFLLPKPPSLNTVYAGKHYAVRQKYKKDYFEQIREVFQHIDEFRAETFQLHLWHNTRLDCDNLILAIKFLSDFLVAEEMVANDNKKHFKKLSISVAEDDQEVPKNFIKVKLILGNYESNN
jgi:hypothetical protein